jgi:hypothetical protein
MNLVDCDFVISFNFIFKCRLMGVKGYIYIYIKAFVKLGYDSMSNVEG